MSEGDDATEKEHEPTQKRLDDARAKGDFARSADLNTAAAFAGLLLAALAFGPANLRQFGDLGMGLLDQADRLGPVMVSDATGAMGGLMAQVARLAAPWFLLPAAMVVLSLLAQRAVVFTPDKLMPKLSRLSPLVSAKQKFGRDGLFEFAKSLVKLSVVSAILGTFLVQHLAEIMGAGQLSPAMATAALMRLVAGFLFAILLISGGFGALDYLWQRASLIRRNRMSRQDMIDEARESDGDPHMKAQRRQRGHDIAMNRMMLDVPKADVVIVNPTHYAVALKWKRTDFGAPVLVAKGTDAVAARIREAAAAAGVPIHRDPPTARALFATIRIGQEIAPDQYRAVAAAVRFAEKMRVRAREQGRTSGGEGL